MVPKTHKISKRQHVLFRMRGRKDVLNLHRLQGIKICRSATGTNSKIGAFDKLNLLQISILYRFSNLKLNKCLRAC